MEPEPPPELVTFDGLLGIDPTIVPSLTDLMGVNSTEDYDGDGDPPKWVSLFDNCLRLVANGLPVKPVLAEIAIVRDRRVLGSRLPYFVSTVLSYSDDSSGDQSVFDAYQKSLGTIEETGTSVCDPGFHKLHHVHIPSSSQSFGGIKVSESPTRASRVPIGTTDTSWKEEVSQADHFSHFFQGFVARIKDGSLREASYLAVPFQRPEKTAAGGKAKLEPAGAVVVIFVWDQCLPASKRSRIVAQLASNVRQAMLTATLRDSFGQLDLRDEAVAAYETLGHVFRVFVEATAHRESLDLIRATKRTAQISPTEHRDLSRVEQSLRFFEHAESLGSLSRLSGWVGRRRVDKLTSCYDMNQVESLKRGDLDAEVCKGLGTLVHVLADALKSKFAVDFNVIVRGESSRQPKEYPALAEIVVPPFANSVVVLAISASVLEPMRNAASHARKSSTDEPVEVRVRGTVDSGYQVLVGNQLDPNVGAKAVGQTSVHGIELVRGLLKRNRLGYIRLAESSDFEGSPEPTESSLWICVDIHPLALLELAQEL